MVAQDQRQHRRAILASRFGSHGQQARVLTGRSSSGLPGARPQWSKGALRPDLRRRRQGPARLRSPRWRVRGRVGAPLRRVEARGRRGGEALLSLRGPPAADGGGALPLHVRPAVEGDQARPPRVRQAVEDAEGGGAPPLPLQLHVRPAVEGAVEDVEGGGALPLRVRPAVVEGGVGVGAEPQALVAGVGDAAQGGEAVVVAVADDKSAARESASIELGVVYQQMEAVWVKIEREVEERRKNREIAKKTRDWASAIDSTKRSEAKIDDLIKQYDSHSRRASELRLKMVNLQTRPISPPPRLRRHPSHLLPRKGG